MAEQRGRRRRKEKEEKEGLELGCGGRERFFHFFTKCVGPAHLLLVLPYKKMEFYNY